MSAISYLDRVNISIAAQHMQRDFHLTDIQLGYVFSAFVMGYALFQAPGGRLSDRFGPRIIVTLGVIWWGIFTSLTAAVPAGMVGLLGVLISVRLLLGMGEAVLYPASNRLVANWIPSQERGIANGLIFSGVGAGAGVTPPLIIWLLIHYGWRESFYVSAILGCIAGAVWYVLARDTPQTHPWVNKEELRHIETGLPEPPSELEKGKALPWATILTNKDVAAITLSYFAYGYTAWIFFSWFFIYLSRVRGLDLKSSSTYSMLPFIGMALCSPIGGWISDRLTARYGKRVGRCGIAVIGMAFAGIFVALGTGVQSPQLASVVLAGGAGALYLAQSSYWSVSADIAGASAGSVSGIMNMGAQIGGAVTALVTPMIAESLGWNASFLVAAGLCIGGSLAWLLVDPNREMVARPVPTGKL